MVMNQNPIQPLEVNMFTRMFIVTTVLMGLVSACAPPKATDVPAQSTDIFEVGIEPATATSDNQAVKDELEPAMKAMFSGITDDTLALMQFVEVPCANVDGLGGPPPCPEGVSEGTALEVFPTLGSEGTLVSREDLTNMLVNLQVKSLYAVYREIPNPNAEPHYQPGEYAMLFEREMNDMPMPIVLQVTDGRIVRIDYHIGISPEEILKEIPVENVIVPPQEAKAWTESVR
jgi:hypothetical protein